MEGNGSTVCGAGEVGGSGRVTTTQFVWVAVRLLHSTAMLHMALAHAHIVFL
jgi:hypothetical protein